MDVGEQDFHILKRDQSILVEFNVYPMKLIELLELCLIGTPSLLITMNSSNPNNNTSNDATTNNNNNRLQSVLSSSSSVVSNHNVFAALDSSTSTFIAKLDLTTGIFSVVEANKFKQLTHISLLLKPADDQAIKMYLASRLALILNMNKKHAMSIEDLRSRLSIEEDNNQQLSNELKNIK
jgi:spindle assembly abnormal protein 6